MKKYIYRFFLMAMGLVAFASCTEDEGTEPGHDSEPNIALYQSTPSAPNDPDLDVQVLVAANNKVTDVYYFCESPQAKEERGLDENAYASYIIENGTKVSELVKDEAGNGKNATVIVNCKGGDNVVTFVAVGGNKHQTRSFDFRGIPWTTLAKGTYYFAARPQAYFEMESAKTEFQQCGDDPTLFRYRDLYGPGIHLQLVKTQWKGEDEDGPYTFYRVPAQPTAFAYGTYGTIYVRDLGYWQNDDSYCQDLGYGVAVWDNDYYGYLHLQLHVTAGSLGWAANTDTDQFVPGE